MINRILYSLEYQSKKKIIFLIFSNFLIGVLEMISFGLVFIYIKFVLFNEIIFENKINSVFPFFFNLDKLNQTTILSLLVISIFIVKNFFLLILIKIESNITEKIFFDLKYNLSKIIFKLPYIKLLETYSSDEIINIIIKDTEKYKYTLTEFVKLCRETIIIFCLMMLIFYQSFILSVFSIIFFLLITLFIIFYFKPIFKKLGKELRLTEGYIIKKSLNIFLSIKIIKLFKKEFFFNNILTDLFSDFEKIVKKNYYLSFQPRVFLELAVILLILTIINFFVYKNYAIEDLIPLITLITATFVRMLPSFTMISNSINAIKYNQFSIDKLNKNILYLRSFNKVLGKTQNQKLNINFDKKFKLSLKNVNFKFKDKIIFNNLNVSFNSNSFISIYGKSGEGKSTLLNIISGLFKLDNGNIFINEQNIYQNLDEWYSHIGYVDQETIILSDNSILENIAFGDEYPDINLFRKVMKKVNLLDYVASLPKKELTKVTEFGKNLSVGQRQRIGIARALYKKPKILLLDEPTSSLDDKNEKEILNNLNTLKKEMMVIMVTHKKSAEYYSDYIYSVSQGKIFELSKIN